MLVAVRVIVTQGASTACTQAAQCIEALGAAQLWADTGENLLPLRADAVTFDTNSVAYWSSNFGAWGAGVFAGKM